MEAQGKGNGSSLRLAHGLIWPILPVAASQHTMDGARKRGIISAGFVRCSTAFGGTWARIAICKSLIVGACCIAAQYN